jgi:hypothetical protein
VNVALAGILLSFTGISQAAPSLHEQQIAFANRVPQLINKAFELGYSVSLGDAYRDARCTYGSSTSKHASRLAIDLNLFKGDVYLNKTSDHKKLGVWWESIGGVWGGRFGDGNHYEAPEDGVWK